MSEHHPIDNPNGVASYTASITIGSGATTVIPGQSSLDPDSKSGSLLGRFVLLDHLGSGGMGEVFSAYDPMLDRTVAIKLLHEMDNPRAQARLLREAQATAGCADALYGSLSAS